MHRLPKPSLLPTCRSVDTGRSAWLHSASSSPRVAGAHPATWLPARRRAYSASSAARSPSSAQGVQRLLRWKKACRGVWGAGSMRLQGTGWTCWCSGGCLGLLLPLPASPNGSAPSSRPTHPPTHPPAAAPAPRAPPGSAASPRRPAAAPPRAPPWGTASAARCPAPARCRAAAPTCAAGVRGRRGREAGPWAGGSSPVLQQCSQRVPRRQPSTGSSQQWCGAAPPTSSGSANGRSSGSSCAASGGASSLSRVS